MKWRPFGNASHDNLTKHLKVSIITEMDANQIGMWHVSKQLKGFLVYNLLKVRFPGSENIQNQQAVIPILLQCLLYRSCPSTWCNFVCGLRAA